MTPREHYDKAGDLMARVAELDALLPIAKALTAQAQVHATLATCPSWFGYNHQPRNVHQNAVETRETTGDRL